MAEVKFLEYTSILILSACSIVIPTIAIDNRHLGNGGVITWLKSAEIALLNSADLMIRFFNFSSITLS